MPPKTRMKHASKTPLDDAPDEKRVKTEPRTPPRKSKTTGESTPKSKHLGPAPDVFASPPRIDVEKLVNPLALKLFSEVKVTATSGRVFLFLRIVFGRISHMRAYILD